MALADRCRAELITEYTAHHGGGPCRRSFDRLEVGEHPRAVEVGRGGAMWAEVAEPACACERLDPVALRRTGGEACGHALGLLPTADSPPLRPAGLGCRLLPHRCSADRGRRECPAGRLRWPDCRHNHPGFVSAVEIGYFQHGTPKDSPRHATTAGPAAFPRRHEAAHRGTAGAVRST